MTEHRLDLVTRVENILGEEMTRDNTEFRHAWKMGEHVLPAPDDTDHVPPEAFMVIWRAIEGLRRAVIEVADEIDQMRRSGAIPDLKE